jgi:hypothetical protein
MVISVNSYNCTQCFWRYAIDAKVFVGFRCLRCRRFVEVWARPGGRAAKSDVRASQDRVTICRVEQDPHPVLRRVFQAGGRERRDMIRNSPRCNRDEFVGPARNAMCLWNHQPYFCTPPSRLQTSRVHAV